MGSSASNTDHIGAERIQAGYMLNALGYCTSLPYARILYDTCPNDKTVCTPYAQ